jgi:hypothetical protein
MVYLFNSGGQHIANFVGKQLHAPTGENICHYLSDQRVSIDMSGHYLGEIVQGNRLMCNRANPYRSTNFGAYCNYGNAENYGNPGNHGSIGTIGGYEDVQAE